MKKIFIMMIAVFGIAIAANGQADQCRLEGGNGGYIDAYVSGKLYMDKTCTDNSCPH